MQALLARCLACFQVHRPRLLRLFHLPRLLLHCRFTSSSSPPSFILLVFSAVVHRPRLLSDVVHFPRLVRRSSLPRLLRRIFQPVCRLLRFSSVELKSK